MADSRAVATSQQLAAIEAKLVDARAEVRAYRCRCAGGAAGAGCEVAPGRARGLGGWVAEPADVREELGGGTGVCVMWGLGRGCGLEVCEGRGAGFTGHVFRHRTALTQPH